MIKVLVVDDNEMQHELIRCYAMLQDHIHIRSAVSLNDAIPQIENDMPDVIFLDNRLHPHNDFTATAPALREAGFSGSMAVISSDIDHPVFKQMPAYSVQKAIDKSEFSIESFPQVLEELINSRAD